MSELNFIEKLIIKSALQDERFLVMISNTVTRKFFATKEAAHIFKHLADHYNAYKQTPSKDMIISVIEKDDVRKDVLEYINEVEAIDFDIARQFDYLIDTTDKWLKSRALQGAIMDSADIISEGAEADYGKVRDLVESALTKTLKIDLGLNYFDSLSERLKRIFTASDVRVPTGFTAFDEYINGGFPGYTLSMGAARVHGNKSGWMANCAARQVLMGYSPVMFTLEMSEDAFGQRFDSIFTGLDINRIYSTKKAELVKALQNVTSTEGRGNLYIKQFPPTTASINEFRAYLHELEMRKMKFDIIYADYANLMKPAYKSKGSLYEDVKRITEELRALSFEYKVPVVSVTQLNRAGMSVGFDEVDFNYISESIGIAATADMMFILGVDEDMQTYQNEIHYKIVKNRLGGRVGEIDKFYFDNRSLKLYDSTELDEWIAAADKSNGSRVLQQRKKRKRRHDEDD